MTSICFVHQTSGRSSPAREFYKKTERRNFLKMDSLKQGANSGALVIRKVWGQSNTAILKSASHKGEPGKVSK